MNTRKIAEEILDLVYRSPSDPIDEVVAILERRFGGGVEPADLVMDCRKKLAAAVPELRKIHQLCRAADHILVAAKRDGEPDHDRILVGELPIRVRRVLSRRDARNHENKPPITTWSELATLTVDEIMSYRNIGEATVDSMRAALASRGLCFADE